LRKSLNPAITTLSKAASQRRPEFFSERAGPLKMDFRTMNRVS
jgi:hypothetical protein